MKTTALPTDSAASVTTASVEAHDAKPSRKVRVSKKAPRVDAASTAKKGKAPRGAKAEKAPRKSRKAGKAAPVEAVTVAAMSAPSEAPPGEPLPLGDVYANPNQPRKLFDQRELEELAASIKETGRLIQPITVVLRAQPDGKGKYMIVCGERRYRAHVLLGWATIDATVVDMNDEQIADAAIIENLQRKDISPLEEARAYQGRLDTGLTVDQLAQRLGLKQSWRITERTALLKLTPEHQDAFARGALSSSQAYEMSRLGATMQRVLFNAIGAGKCRSYAELRKTVEALAQRESQIEMPTEAPGFEPPTAAEHERVRELEVMIGAVCELVQKGFSGNDVVILRKVNLTNAEVLADQLELIEASLRKLRLELRAGAVARLAETTASPEPAAMEPSGTDQSAAESASEAPAPEPAIETPAEPVAERVVEIDAGEQVDQAA